MKVVSGTVKVLPTVKSNTTEYPSAVLKGQESIALYSEWKHLSPGNKSFKFLTDLRFKDLRC